MSLVRFILLALLFALLPQQPDRVFYIESWKQGKQKVQEQNFDITLSLAKSVNTVPISKEDTGLWYEIAWMRKTWRAAPGQ